jgi:D-alanyl-D-alanine endopeptidase (penicillin-binding protein 7)
MAAVASLLRRSESMRLASPILVLTLVLACAPCGGADERSRDNGHSGALTSSVAGPVEAPAVAELAPPLNPQYLHLISEVALVADQRTGRILYAKNADVQTPIASITKLMTAMVMLDAGLPMERRIQVSVDDVDHLRNSGSRLRVGSVLSRRELLQLALMSSENRAAAALARTYPGGTAAFVPAMNRKAKDLGMRNTVFADPTGLDSRNTSVAEDLVKMVKAALRYPLIQRITTTPRYLLMLPRFRRPLEYRNTNALVRDGTWDIGLSKTGYISESGHCLVMQATIAGREVVIVLLNAQGRLSRFGDANRIRRWIEAGPTGRRSARG